MKDADTMKTTPERSKLSKTKPSKTDWSRFDAMTEAQRQVILARDWNGMIALGGNIYFLSKLFSSDGKSFQHVAAIMTGSSQEAYAQMMKDGGRSPDGNRSLAEWKKRG